ncbi:unnamed protein product [Prorocentrum cordatum]|uniref:Uncharacterized protein n=1 Tax=Prorocentrum cordatum TaxID=2364126 RepID=A0ABN9T4S9_9DINO|nr:unnamed protein product [Polarella glacialis]
MCVSEPAPIAEGMARLQEAFRNGTSPYMPGCLGGVDLGVDLGPLLDLTASSCGSELRAAAASAAAEPAPNPTGAALEQQVALDLTASSAAPSPRTAGATDAIDLIEQQTLLTNSAADLPTKNCHSHLLTPGLKLQELLDYPLQLLAPPVDGPPPSSRGTPNPGGNGGTASETLEQRLSRVIGAQFNSIQHDMQQHITASMSAAMAHAQQELVSSMQIQLAPTVARLTAAQADARRQQAASSSEAIDVARLATWDRPTNPQLFSVLKQESFVLRLSLALSVIPWSVPQVLG